MGTRQTKRGFEYDMEAMSFIDDTITYEVRCESGVNNFTVDIDDYVDEYNVNDITPKVEVIENWVDKTELKWIIKEIISISINNDMSVLMGINNDGFRILINGGTTDITNIDQANKWILENR